MTNQKTETSIDYVATAAQMAVLLEALGAVGHEPVAVHLMEADVLENGALQPRFGIKGDMVVTAGTLVQDKF